VPVGFFFEVQEYSRLQWTTNNFTVGRNGNDINDSATDYVCDVGGATLRFTKKASADWEVSIITALSINPDTSLVKLQRYEASNDATLEFTGFVDTALYSHYNLVVDALLPATDAARPYLQFSEDGGSTWYTGTVNSYNHYAYSANENRTYESVTNGVLLSAGSLGNVATTEKGCFADLTLTGFGRTGIPHIFGPGMYADSGTNVYTVVVGGGPIADITPNAFRLIMSTGNIASGSATLMGIRK